MTAATVADARRKVSALNRRVLHLERIGGAERGTAKYRHAVMAWLAAEVVASGRVDEVFALADSMNRQVAR